MPCRSRLSLLGRGASKWLIIPAVGNNKLRHERPRHFMLANDSVTVAIEIPIWLTEADITALERGHGILAPRNHPAERAITGHIDFSKMRNGPVHVLDYKPDARTNRRIAQLAIYARPHTASAGLKPFDIKCRWFNEEEYCEMFPRTLLRRIECRDPKIGKNFLRRQRAFKFSCAHCVEGRWRAGASELNVNETEPSAIGAH
jgi:hypothetical protein